MEILEYLFVIILFCTIPAVVILLCRKVSLLGKIGPIMVLYAIGMAIANIPFMPQEQLASIQEILPNILIPLAIPMMLYGCKFTLREAKLQIKVVASGILSVALAVAAGYIVFGKSLPQGAQTGGIITGMYTGGTLNAAALQTIFNVNSESFVLINSYDIIISFLYFIFLFSFGIKMFRRLYGNAATNNGCTACNSGTAETEDNPVAGYRESSEDWYRKLATRDGMVQMGKILALTIAVAAVSAATALLLPDNLFMVVFILMITTLGVACSFIPAVKEFNISYDAGMYLIYIFSITIASMADFSKLSLESGTGLLGFMTLAVFLSLTLHAIFCRILKTDADSMTISSVAFINSPPFVPMASAFMKNRNALVTGLAAGIAGYAIGNHLGIMVSWLLSCI